MLDDPGPPAPPDAEWLVLSVGVRVDLMPAAARKRTRGGSGSSSSRSPARAGRTPSPRGGLGRRRPRGPSSPGICKNVGTVLYIGRVAFAPGNWVGIELDDCWGDHDGAVGGRRYFTCRPHHGIFVRSDECSRAQAQTALLHHHFKSRELRQTENKVKHELSVKAHMIAGAADRMPRPQLDIVAPAAAAATTTTTSSSAATRATEGGSTPRRRVGGGRHNDDSEADDHEGARSLAWRSSSSSSSSSPPAVTAALAGYGYSAAASPARPPPCHGSSSDGGPASSSPAAGSSSSPLALFRTPELRRALVDCGAAPAAWATDVPDTRQPTTEGGDGPGGAGGAGGAGGVGSPSSYESVVAQRDKAVALLSKTKEMLALVLRERNELRETNTRLSKERDDAKQLAVVSLQRLAKFETGTPVAAAAAIPALAAAAEALRHDSDAVRIAGQALTGSNIKA